jgi:hypothetical protein
MTTKLNWIFGIFIALIVASCGSSDKKETLDKNEMVAKDFAIKYNAVNNWDTTASYTSHFQKMFIEQNKLMVFRGRIYDIVKMDSNYIVKVLDERTDATHNFLAIITFSSQQLDAVYTDEKSATGIFVIKVSKVTSSNPSIKEDEESDGDDHTYTYNHLSDDRDQMITIFTGTAIACHLEPLEESK